MKLLVIGGTGFIGRHVVRRLVEMGHRVAVLHRGVTAGAFPESVEHVIADQKDLERGLPADVVVDMILASERQARRRVAAFAGVAGRLVAISSMDVYRACGILHGTEPGEPDNRPLGENAPLRTEHAPYSRETFESLKKVFTWLEDDYDKIPVERVVMAEPRLPGTVLRLPMVYGPGDPLHRLHPILKRIDDGRPAILLEQSQAGWRGPRGYVENVAEGIALAATDERAGGRIYNVAEPEAFSELEWTRRVAEAAGWPGRIRVLDAERMPPHLRMPYNFRQHWVPDSSRIRSELGYRESVPFAEGLRRTIAWERANPPEQYLRSQFDYPAEDAALENP